jgi:hypothetical protein
LIAPASSPAAARNATVPMSRSTTPGSLAAEDCAWRAAGT